MTEIHSKQKGTAERGSNIDELRCKIHLSVRPYLESNNREDQTFGFFPLDDLCLLIHVMFPLRFGDLFCHDGKKQRGFQVAPDCECEQWLKVQRDVASAGAGPRKRRLKDIRRRVWQVFNVRDCWAPSNRSPEEAPIFRTALLNVHQLDVHLLRRVRGQSTLSW